MYRRFFKPLLDFFLALILSILVTPLIAVLCFFIVLESKGSPLFVQTRVGKGLRHFPLFKLRTMVSGADKLGSYQTAKNDQRITRMGRILRLTSLDELPQVWNILLGHMSFIGPRPDVPVMEKLYTAEQWQRRHLIRPGITGLAQATIRSSGTQEQRTQLDLEYVENVSLLKDLKIIFSTFSVLIKTRLAN